MGRLHIHWDHYVGEKGVNAYYECRCGRRKVLRGGLAHSAVDRAWLAGGPWRRPQVAAPRSRQVRGATPTQVIVDEMRR